MPVQLLDLISYLVPLRAAVMIIFETCRSSENGRHNDIIGEEGIVISTWRKDKMTFFTDDEENEFRAANVAMRECVDKIASIIPDSVYNLAHYEVHCEHDHTENQQLCIDLISDITRNSYLDTILSEYTQETTCDIQTLERIHNPPDDFEGGDKCFFESYGIVE